MLTVGPMPGRPWCVLLHSAKHAVNNGKGAQALVHRPSSLNATFTSPSRTSARSRELAKDLRDGRLESDGLVSMGSMGSSMGSDPVNGFEPDEHWNGSSCKTTTERGVGFPKPGRQVSFLRSSWRIAAMSCRSFLRTGRARSTRRVRLRVAQLESVHFLRRNELTPRKTNRHQPRYARASRYRRPSSVAFATSSPQGEEYGCAARRGMGS
jgi:hypothetical protein